MVFTLDNTMWSRSLLKDYPPLSKYGYHDEEFQLDSYGTAKIVINSIEELVSLSREINQPLIIDISTDYPHIEIYDTWRE